MGRGITQQVILLVIAVVDLGIGLFVFSRNRSSIVHRVFFAFTLGIALWISSVALVFITRHLIFSHLTFYGGIVMYTSLLLFAKVFPYSKAPSRLFLWTAFLPAALVMLLVPFGLFVERINVLPDGSVTPVNGPAMPLFAAALIGYLGYSLVLLGKSYRRAHGLVRAQMQYFFLGLVIFVTGSVIFDAILPSLGIFHLNLLGPASSIIFLGSVAYAIVRHQLMDIRVVIQLGLVYTATAVIVIGFYLAVINILGFFLQRTTNISILVSAGLTTLVGVFGAPHVEGYLRRLTDRVFFKGRYKYADALHELSEALNRNIELKPLLEDLSFRLKRIFRTNEAEFVLCDKSLPAEQHQNRSGDLASRLEGGLEIIIHSETPHGHSVVYRGEECRRAIEEIQNYGRLHGIELTVPITLENKVIALLHVGGKLSGDAYTGEDLQLLKTFVRQAAVALEKAKLYKRVQDHSRELEKRVRERTGELTLAQENQRKMMVDIAHALQTPLTVVKGELDILKRKISLSKNLKAFEKSISNTSKLTYDLLELAKLEAGKETIYKKSVDFSQTLNELVEYFSLLAEEQGVTVTSKIDPGVIILGDRSQLEELVTNLLSNALKYVSRSKSKKISISLRRKRNSSILSVEDTGIGISQEDLPHIFEAFYRAEHKTDSRTLGTGLGLAIAKKIVDQHGGAIRAESQEGRGAKFTITLELERV